VAGSAIAQAGPTDRAITLPTWSEFQSARALLAMQVPAFNRGVRLISGTVAQLPLQEWDTYNGARRRNNFLAQPDPSHPYWVTMQRTVRDLVLYGSAHWQITSVSVTDGYPNAIRHLEHDKVSPIPGNDRSVYVDGVEKPVSNPGGNALGAVEGMVIRFDGYNDGALITGVDVLTTALAQEAAARNYSEAPAPTQILKNTSNYELDDTEITELIAVYQSARQNSAVAYLNSGVDLTTFGYSAHELQLVEARNQSAIQIARLLNLDPFWVGAGVPGSALTYQNRVDMRQDLVDLTLSDYINPIEQRLSMPDVLTTKYKNQARFDPSQFLRSNLEDRARIAIDLFTAGVIDQAEARTFVSDKPSGGPA
jgi:HK97 family phage portal protein